MIPMIDPRDIWDAHRVVKSPSSFRPGKISRPVNVLPTLRGIPALTNGQRRRAALRTATASIGARVRNARAVTVRSILPAIRKR